MSGEAYGQLRHNAWDEARPSETAELFYGRARARVHQAFLAENPPTGGRRLLDVGSGLGYFLAAAQAAGWRVQGIDTSESWVHLSNQRLGGEVVELGLIETSRFAPGSFDLITAWDVLEHVFDPVPFLRRLRELLAPGGRLFIRTPNLWYVYPVYGARRALLRQAVELGPTNHVVYFSPTTIRTALRQAGLQPVGWPVLVPPQVALDPARPQGTVISSAMVTAKNAYAHLARWLAESTEGRAVISSDLDVMCAATAD